MKKIFKNPIFMYILGFVTAIGITSVLAYSIFAPDVGYTPKDGTWKNQDGEVIDDVQSAIDELREMKYGYINLEFVDVVKGGKNETSSASAFSVSKELEKGKYLVTIVRSTANSNATSDLTNTESGAVGTLSGYDNLEHLVYTRYGKYQRSSSNYPNQYVSMHKVIMNDTGTLKFQFESNIASTNLQMIIFRIK